MISAAPLVLGPLTLASPVVLYAAAAAAAPIIIHLALRRRFRRIAFPAIRFVMASHQAGRRANRLKYLLLMLLRMVIIFLLVAILAGPSVRTTERFIPAAAPADVVFCFDDSASMGYRHDGRTRFHNARQWADQLVADASRFPPGSRFTVLSAWAPEQVEPLSPALSNVRAAYERLAPRPHDRGIGAMLAEAYRILVEADRSRKEIYLFNDLTEHSWRDVRRPVGGGENVAVICLDVGQTEVRNFSLELATKDPRIRAAGKVLWFSVAVRSFDLGARRQIELRADGKVVARSGAVSVPGHARQTITLEAGPFQVGIHQLEIRFTQPDALEIDDRRFVTIEVGDPVRVVVVGNGQGDGPASEARLIRAMIAPAALGPSRSYYSVSHCTAGDLPALRAEKLRFVILADVADVSSEAWAWIRRFVHDGGVLIVVPGDSLIAARYSPAADLLGVLPVRVERCDPPARLQIANTTHPYLEPFNDSENDSLTHRGAVRRLIVTQPGASAQMLAGFRDGAPAIIARKVNAGRTLLLAFSPAPEWGDFGTQAGPFLVFVHTVLRHHAPESTRTDQVVTGSRAFLKPAEIPFGATCLVRSASVDTGVMPPERLESNPEAGFLLDTDVPGNYELTFGEGETVVPGGYAVNLPIGETEAARKAPDRLADLFFRGRFQLADDPEKSALRAQERWVGRSIAGELALALLIGLMIESLYANRFYGKNGG